MTDEYGICREVHFTGHEGYDSELDGRLIIA